MKIISNGSKYYGQENDSIEVLLEVLATHPLDPSFEEFGNFFYEPTYINPQFQPPLGTWRASGNFWEVSHVFNIEGTAEEMEPLRLAIEANKARPDYIAARKVYLEREAREKSERVERENLRQSERKIVLERELAQLSNV